MSNLVEDVKFLYDEILLNRLIPEFHMDHLFAEKLGITVEEFRARINAEWDEDELVSEVPMVSIPLDDPYFTTPSDTPFPTEREKELMRKMWGLGW